jgi:hypothetical protein
MWSDPEYLRSGRDLRRREILFWPFVLSYAPSVLLIIVVVNVFPRETCQSALACTFPERGWLAFSGQVSTAKIFVFHVVIIFSSVVSWLPTRILKIS